MSLTLLPLQAALVYCFLLLLLRLSGRRGLRQAQVPDLVVALMLSHSGVSFISGGSNAAEMVTASGTLLLLHLSLNHVLQQRRMAQMPEAGERDRRKAG